MSDPVLANGDTLTPDERLVVLAVAAEVARAILRLPKEPMRRVVMTQAQWLLDGRACAP